MKRVAAVYGLAGNLRGAREGGGGGRGGGGGQRGVLSLTKRDYQMYCNQQTAVQLHVSNLRGERGGGGGGGDWGLVLD